MAKTKQKKPTTRRRTSRHKGISRIDQPDKHNHGWFVRVTRNGKTHSMFCADKKHGGKTKALAEAKKCYQLLRAKYPPMSRKDFAQIRRRRNKSGIVGVTRLTKIVGGKEYHFWQATWSPARGNIQKKAFSITKFGEEKAKQLAIQTRKKGLKAMSD